MSAMNLLFVLGTRPEVIKLAPVILLGRKCPEHFNIRVAATGQHRELVAPLFDFFEIQPDYNLDVLKNAKTPTQVAADILQGLEPVYGKEKPDWVVVQGDTTTVVAAALGAFYQRVKVAHVEAGLRTYDRFQPFPEEINRRVTSAIADLHLAPTDGARGNLLKENISGAYIVVTGNTVIDALLLARDKIRSAPDRHAASIRKWLATNVGDARIVLITGHRRENIGQGFVDICRAVEELAKRYADAHFVYPVHLNPQVRDTVMRDLGDISNVHLIDPLGYSDFVYLMDHSTVILTDSGGVQEEAPSLGKPVLVMRNTTERPEGLTAGTSILVGSDYDKIIAETSRLLDGESDRKKMASIQNPYGDGKASERVLKALREY